MEPITQFTALTVLASFAVLCVYIRRKYFALVPKNKKFTNDYIIDFIELVLISWPPLIPLVGIIYSSGQNMGWYLAVYFGVIIGIFFVWFNTTEDEQKRRQSILTVVIFLGIWTIIGLLIFLLIIQ